MQPENCGVLTMVNKYWIKVQQHLIDRLLALCCRNASVLCEDREMLSLKSGVLLSKVSDGLPQRAQNPTSVKKITAELFTQSKLHFPFQTTFIQKLTGYSAFIISIAKYI